MRHWIYRLMAAAALALTTLSGCVGQVDDEEDDGPVNGDPAGEAGAPGLLFDFTATWCVNCPRMAVAIEEAAAQRPGKVFPVSIHFRDAMAFAAGEAIASRFGIASYPSLIVNLDPSSLTTATAKDLILSRMDATAAGRKAACTVVGTVEDGRINVDITAAEAGNYRLAALLLEDGIVAPQTGGTDTYVHNDVLRAILSSDIDGDPLGSLTAGASAQRTITLPNDLPARGHLLLYVMDADRAQLNAISRVII